MKLLLLLLFFSACLCSTLLADDWGPWEVPSQQAQQTTTSKDPLQLAVRLFQKYISPVDGPRCPMYPTCSSYALQALRKHGPLLGTFLTVDRLYHEGDRHEQQQPIDKWGFVRFYDPLENNDFWLKQSKRKTHIISKKGLKQSNAQADVALISRSNDGLIPEGFEQIGASIEIGPQQ